MLIIISGILVSNNLPSELKLYLPFTYMNARYIANGALQIKENLANSSLFMTISILIISTVLFNSVGILLARKVKQ